jgi:hypothetical protein
LRKQLLDEEDKEFEEASNLSKLADRRASNALVIKKFKLKEPTI